MGEDRQSTAVEFTSEGQIKIHYEWHLENGLEMGGEFVFQAASASWLADCLEKAADDNLSDTDGGLPPDQLRIYIGGGHRYDDINVNISNQRDPNSVYGRLYVLSAMTRSIARTLAGQLRAIL